MYHACTSSDGDYAVLVATGGDENGSTDAKVTLTVFGERGDSGPLPLEKEGEELFKPGATDEFKVGRYSFI